MVYLLTTWIFRLGCCNSYLCINHTDSCRCGYICLGLAHLSFFLCSTFFVNHVISTMHLDPSGIYIYIPVCQHSLVRMNSVYDFWLLWNSLHEIKMRMEMMLMTWAWGAVCMTHSTVSKFSLKKRIGSGNQFAVEKNCYIRCKRFKKEIASMKKTASLVAVSCVEL